MDSRPRVLIAIPNRGTVDVGVFTACIGSGPGTQHRIFDIRLHSSSLLAMCFNSLWSSALNDRGKFDYFVMLHADVCPDLGWVDTLLRELEYKNADVMSAIIPMKDDRGLTSTALMDPLSGHIRRLTMTEVHKLPETFAAEDIGFPGWAILPNTGCWICDFRQPWVENFCFHMHDRIIRDEEGYKPQCLSEDWNFGIDAVRLGLKVCATRAVKIFHNGGFQYPNFAPWGGWETDQEVGIAFKPIRETEETLVNV